MALTQTQLATAVADRTGMSKAEAKRALEALEDVVLEEIEIAAKPASVDVRARPLAKTKGALPSIRKARRRLEG